MGSIIPVQKKPNIKIVIKRNGQNRNTGELTTRYDTLYLNIPILHRALEMEFDGVRDCTVVECVIAEDIKDE